MKALMEEEKKEAEQDGDDNGGTDVEDSTSGNDVETDEEKEAEGEEYAIADSTSQENILLQFYFFDLVVFCVL